MSGYPTYQDLSAWSVDNFRFADHPGVGQSTQYKRVCQDLRVLQEFQ